MIRVLYLYINVYFSEHFKDFFFLIFKGDLINFVNDRKD